LPTAKPPTCEKQKLCQPERRAVPLTDLLGLIKLICPKDGNDPTKKQPRLPDENGTKTKPEKPAGTTEANNPATYAGQHTRNRTQPLKPKEAQAAKRIRGRQYEQSAEVKGDYETNPQKN
jgi:hypothetical protein